MVARLTEQVVSTRVRVKICGITRPRDALDAAYLGADAIGLIFYPNSPRAIDINTARQIVSVLPPFISKVGLFVNAKADEIQAVLQAIPLDLLQFHGEEEPALCNCFSRPFIKAVRMQDNVDLKSVAERYTDASALLLDSYVKGVQGGTGTSFDWSRIPSDIGKPLILAGGLTINNVHAAIKQVKPYAVDVSGGVELEKGVKDANKIAEFIQEVRNAENQYGSRSYQ